MVGCIERSETHRFRRYAWRVSLRSTHHQFTQRKRVVWVLTMYTTALADHYESVWGTRGAAERWSRGPIEKDLPNFSVLAFAPTPAKPLWVYATCGMSERADIAHSIELHVFSEVKDESLTELLAIVAHYHNFGGALDLGHTVDFGRPWQQKSKCTFGLVSLPYLYGPKLENFEYCGSAIRCLWLVPITEKERHFKMKHGLERLEEAFELRNFDYADAGRESVV